MLFEEILTALTDTGYSAEYLLSCWRLLSMSNLSIHDNTLIYHSEHPEFLIRISSQRRIHNKKKDGWH